MRLLRDVAWADLFCTHDLVRCVCLPLVRSFLPRFDILSTNSNLFVLQEAFVSLGVSGVLDSAFVVECAIECSIESLAGLQLCAVDW